MSPRSRKSGYGLLSGCRSGLDEGPFKKTFCWWCSKKQLAKNRAMKIFTPSVRCSGPLYRNRSSVVELVRREPLMFAKVENGVTKSCQHFRRKNSKKMEYVGVKFSTFLSAGSLIIIIVFLATRVHKIGMTEFPIKNSQKRRRTFLVSEILSKSGCASLDIFIMFLAAEKLFGGGG